MIKQWTLPIAALACAGFALGGCASKQQADSGTNTGGAMRSAQSRAAAAEPVEILDLVRGDSEALSLGGVTLIKDEADLQEVGLQLEGLSPDWGRQDVVVLALGEQNSGGFWADIKGIQLVGDTLFVQSVVNRPGDDAAATQAITHPYAAALIGETTATRAQGDYEEVVGQPMPE